MAKDKAPDLFNEIIDDAMQRPQSAPSATSAPVSATGATSAPPPLFKKHGVEIRIEYLEKLKELAYWKRRRLRDLIDEALCEYLSRQDDPRKTESERT